MDVTPVEEPVAQEEPSGEGETPPAAEQTLPREGAAGDRAAAIDEFLERFPDVEPSGIPQSVWQKFMQGESLALAWAMHCNGVLESRLEQLARQEDNRRRTPGALGSTTPEPDELDRAWAED